MSQKTFNPWKRYQGAFIPNWLMRRSHKEISQGAKMCYGRLVQFAGASGECWPSVPTLAEELGVEKRQATGYLEELRACGLVRVVRTGRASRYQFLEHWWELECADTQDSAHQKTDCVSDTQHNAHLLHIEENQGKESLDRYREESRTSRPGTEASELSVEGSRSATAGETCSTKTKVVRPNRSDSTECGDGRGAERCSRSGMGSSPNGAGGEKDTPPAFIPAFPQYETPTPAWTADGLEQALYEYCGGPTDSVRRSIKAFLEMQAEHGVAIDDALLKQAALDAAAWWKSQGLTGKPKGPDSFQTALKKLLEERQEADRPVAEPDRAAVSRLFQALYASRKQGEPAAHRHALEAEWLASREAAGIPAAVIAEERDLARRDYRATVALDQQMGLLPALAA